MTMDRRRIFIIAEAGVNHNGSIEIAKKLVDAACLCGADAVKFQTFDAAALASASAPKAAYQAAGTPAGETQFEMLKKLELGRDAHMELIRYCGGRGIDFISSPFDLKSVDLLLDIGLKIIKIPSGEITNVPYLRKVGGSGREIIMSTGMATLGEIENALAELTRVGALDVVLLHCTTEYPAPFDDINLNAMVTMRNAFGTRVGYSDHTVGSEVAVAAAALGASVIEKHLTLDRNMEGPDHKASMEPNGFGAMVAAIRNVERALGNGIKAPASAEMANRDIVRKSIVASRKIVAGEIFRDDNITVKRPGGGLSPIFWDMVIGNRACRGYETDEFIEANF